MEKRSMMVDLEKLARKYPSEVAALRESMKRAGEWKVARRAIFKARGLDANHWRAPVAFDGVTGLPAWKVARRLGWSMALLRVSASLYGIRYSPNADGRLYFHPVDVEQVAKIQKEKRRDGTPGLVPTAVSLQEAAQRKGWSVRVLKRTIRERSIFTWLRGDEVRIPMCELERLEGPLHPRD